MEEQVSFLLASAPLNSSLPVNTRNQSRIDDKKSKDSSRVWEWWESGTPGDDVELQAVGTAPQVDQDAVHQGVQ